MRGEVEGMLARMKGIVERCEKSRAGNRGIKKG